MVSSSKGAMYETPGSAILQMRQIADTPDKDFLMNQQGLFSGKTEGDLDSVPGYYGGTASYKFVQNAKALNQHRVQRYMKSTRREEMAVERLLPSLTPSETRVAAYKAAQAVRGVKTLQSKARGDKLKETQPGLRLTMDGVIKKKDLVKAKSNFVKDEKGNLVYRPEEAARAAAAAAVAPAAPALVRVPDRGVIDLTGAAPA
tara:strand:- start:950 stop:1555 length:606 start_codon:yes stop_codon:yes gene_type:complete